MSEYEVYWQMDFPLINSWAHLERLFLKWYALFIKTANKHKKNLVILQLIGIIRSYTL